MAKLKSLFQLRDLGLNTPELLLQIPQFMTEWDKNEEWRHWAAKIVAKRSESGGHLPKISIRTERDGEFKTPHLPNIEFSQAYNEIRWLTHRGYAIYLFEGIDPKDCEIKGNLCLKSLDMAKGGILEYLKGPGTVRSLESTTPESLQFTKPSELPVSVDPIYRDYIKHKFFGDILEWSIYKKPVGLLKHYEIYWELRPWR